MIKDQQKKIVNLAEDICMFGLNPLDITGIYPSPFDDGKFIVGEGNRRITAIKLFNDPEISKPFDQYVYNSFNKLKLKYPHSHFSEVSCFVFKSAVDENLRHWIEIKHLGENEGRGTSNWSALQKERWDRKITGESRLLDFWAELEKNKILNGDEVLEVTKTNWERILRDYGLKYLKISKIKNSLLLPFDDIGEFKRKIIKIHEKLRKQTVAIVYDQNKIEQFFDEINKELYSIPYKNEQQTIFNFDTKNEKKMPSSSTANNDDRSNSKPNHPAQMDVVPKPKKLNPYANENNNYPSDPFSNSATVIPLKYKIRSSNTRINKIIDELSQINVDIHPNACGVLLRALFELSAKYYLENKTGKDQIETEFQQAVKAAANSLIQDKQLHPQDHSSLCNDIDTLRKLFNGYMHNTNSYPSSEAIKNIYKAHKKFIEACLKFK